MEATDSALPVSSRLSVKKTILISIIDINDNSPVFVSPAVGVILENSEAGTEVMTVSAKDKDKGLNAQVFVLLPVEKIIICYLLYSYILFINYHYL